MQERQLLYGTGTGRRYIIHKMITHETGRRYLIHKMNAHGTGRRYVCRWRYILLFGKYCRRHQYVPRPPFPHFKTVHIIVCDNMYTKKICTNTNPWKCRYWLSRVWMGLMFRIIYIFKEENIYACLISWCHQFKLDTFMLRDSTFDQIIMCNRQT